MSIQSMESVVVLCQSLFPRSYVFISAHGREIGFTKMAAEQRASPIRTLFQLLTEEIRQVKKHLYIYKILAGQFAAVHAGQKSP